MTHISVIGSGAWGTALAQTIASTGKNVTLWARNPELARDINAHSENKAYLGGYPLSTSINSTSELKIALQSNIILMVTPAQSMRNILEDMKQHIHAEHVLVLCSKGIELSSGKLMSEVVHEILPNTPVAILSGPNFAHEIAAGKPAATTLACTNDERAKTLQNAIASPTFRPYISNDVIGTQLAGALKNVIAIACGIAHGLQMGESARASLVTRGLIEIARLGNAIGAKHETFLGQCGVGDMMLTCSSEKSRNFSLGYELGKGDTLDEILKRRKTVTEGVHTATSILPLCQKHNIDMPITLAVHKCLNEGLSLDEALQDMLNRPVGHEL